MKKFVVLAVLLIFAVGFCFAQDEAAPAKPEFFDLEISAGFPVHWTNGEVDVGPLAAEYKTVTANTAIGVALLFNFGRKIGLTLDTDFFYGGDVMGISSTDSKSASLFGANVLLGPVFYIYNGTFLRIPLAVGAHMYYYSEDIWVNTHVGGGGSYSPPGWIKSRDLQVGPGAYLGVQFHFNRNIYIYSRTNVAIDVYRWHQVKFTDGTFDLESNSEMEFVVSWSVKPSIGIGIKF